MSHGFALLLSMEASGTEWRDKDRAWLAAEPNCPLPLLEVALETRGQGGLAISPHLAGR